jgi:hypothetical protein
MFTTKAEFRKTLIVPKDPQKVGQGDKQVDLWVIRDRDDKDGSRGSQSTCLSEAAVAWTIDQRYRGHLQMAVNTGEATFAEAQAIAEAEGVGALWDPDAEDPVARKMCETRGALGPAHTLLSIDARPHRDAEFDRQMAIARGVMDRHRDALAGLAKHTPSRPWVNQACGSTLRLVGALIVYALATVAIRKLR